MAVLKLAISSARDDSTLEQNFEVAGGNRAIGTRIINYITSLITGTEGAMSSSVPPSIAISIQENEVQASQTVTLSGNLTANDTLVINGVTFTAVASGATGNQFNIGGSAALTIVAAAACINASATALIPGYVTAAATSATVLTVTSVFYGLAGNTMTIAEGVDAGNVMTVGGARLAAGAADATAQTLTF